MLIAWVRLLKELELKGMNVDEKKKKKKKKNWRYLYKKFF